MGTTPVYVDAVEINTIKNLNNECPQKLYRAIMRKLLGDDILNDEGLSRTGRNDTLKIPEVIIQGAYGNINSE